MKNFKKRLFSIAIALILTFGMLGGAVVTVSANDYNYGVTSSYVNVYTDDMNVTYNGDETYKLTVYAETSGISSYQMSIQVPEFINVCDVTVSEELSKNETDSFMFSYFDGGFNVVYSSAGEYAGYVDLFDVEFSINYAGNYNSCFYQGYYVETMFTDQDANEIGYSFNFGYINVSHEEEVSYAKGDVTLNGIIDLQDLIAVQRYILNNNDGISELEYNLADINNDGLINVKDCQYIQMYLVGELSSLENIGGGVVDTQNYSLEIKLYDQKGSLIHTANTKAQNGQTYADVCRPIFEKLEREYNITSYDSVSSNICGYYDNVEIIGGFIIRGNDVVCVYVTVGGDNGEEQEKQITVTLKVYMDMNGEYSFMNEVPEKVNEGTDILYFMEEYFGDTSATAYYDADFQYSVVSGDVFKNGDVLYVIIKTATAEGEFDLYERDDNGKPVVVGKVNFATDSATVTLGESVYTGAYINMSGSIIITIDKFVQFTIYEDEGKYILNYFFDGSEYETREDLEAVAGETQVLITDGPGLVSAVFYDNGVWELNMGGIIMYNDYELNDTGVTLYLFGRPQDFILNDQGIWEPVYNGGGSGEASRSFYVVILSEDGQILGETPVFDEDGTPYDNVIWNVLRQFGYDFESVVKIYSANYGIITNSYSGLFVDGEDRLEITIGKSHMGGEEYYCLNIYYMYRVDGEFIMIDSSNVGWIEQGDNIYEFVKDYGYDAECITDMYYDQDLTICVEKEDVFTETTDVYVILEDPSVVGEYVLYESVYDDEGNGGDIERGTAVFTEETATVVIDGVTYTGPYVNMLGSIEVVTGEFSQVALYISYYEGEKLYFEHIFDGSDYEVREELNAIAGTYNINMPYEALDYTLTLYNNGVYALNCVKIKMLGEYGLTENGVMLYRYDEGMELIYDAKTNSFAPIGGGETDGPSMPEMSYDITDVYGVYYSMTEEGSILTINEQGFTLTTAKGISYSGVEMYSMYMGGMGQVSLFKGDEWGCTIMLEGDGFVIMTTYDATKTEVTEEYKAVAGNYSFMVNGQYVGEYELCDDGKVIAWNGPFKGIGTYTVVGENIVEVTGSQLLVDKESGALIPYNVDVEDDYVNSEITFVTYVYTDADGITYWIDIRSDGTFYVKSTSGMEDNGKYRQMSEIDYTLYGSQTYSLTITMDGGVEYFGLMAMSDSNITIK